MTLLICFEDVRRDCGRTCRPRARRLRRGVEGHVAALARDHVEVALHPLGLERTGRLRRRRLRQDPRRLRDEEHGHSEHEVCARHAADYSIADSAAGTASAVRWLAPHEQTRPLSPLSRPPRVARGRRAAALPRRRPAVRDLHAGHDPGVLAELLLAPDRPAVAAPSRARPGDDAVARPAGDAGGADPVGPPDAAPPTRSRVVRAGAGHRGRDRAFRALHAAGGAGARQLRAVLPGPGAVDAGGVRDALRAGDGLPPTSRRCTRGS